MHHAALKEQSYRKLALVNQNYYQLIFEKVGEIENACGLQTREHFRTPPAEGLEPLAKGFRWGGLDRNLWVIGTCTVPASAAGQDLYAVSHAGGREELFFVDGKPSGIFSWRNEATSGEHSARLIAANAVPGQTFDLAFECFDRLLSSGENGFDYYSHDTEYDHPHDPTHDDNPGRTYGGIDICVMNQAVKDLYHDLRQLLQIENYRPEHGQLRYHARRVLDKVVENLVLCPQHYEKEVWMASVEKCLSFTRPFFEKENDRAFGRVGVVGHTHLDSAWLWPVNETIRKCARSFSNVFALMDQYPDFKFMQSSALHAEWMKEYYPSVFEEMKRRIAEGRYELNGGVYVECDCNITSGEMMIRQFLKGQQFTKENFGTLSDTFWLPDTFGYNANIPQIMKGCGVKYFCTNKVNCNEVNLPEHESFIWRGIDGSEVLAHIPPAGGFADAKDVMWAGDTVRDKDGSDKHLLCFGFGDGGGGPTWGMLEGVERVMHTEGMPKTDMMLVSEFMRELDSEDREYLFRYDDEIYFEFHRGTLTQNHNVKRKNRLVELAFRNMEYANVLADQPLHPDADKWLKNLLLNQFHDILPGTCINSVYVTYNREMDENLANLRGETNRFLGKMTEDDGNYISLYNTLSFGRRDPVVIEGETRDAIGYPTQHYEDILGRKLTVIGGVGQAPFGAKSLPMAENGAKESVGKSVFTYDEGTGHIETPFASVDLDGSGAIASFVDKPSGRELRREGGAPLNSFLLAEDLPEKWDNWNIDSDTMDRLHPVGKLISREVVTDGEVELRLRSRYELTARTTAVQDMVFYADTPRVDFHTLIDWNDKHALLKAGFDLALRAREAKCEIQYGHVNRPTHGSTPYDMAKFEVCNHKWTDISESRFGVAMLNDCKYGVSFLDCNLAISLHCGGTMPDGTGDRGVHEMTYSLLPHTGAFDTERVIRPAYELNVPTLTLQGVSRQTGSFLTLGAPNVICEAVKPAERGTCAYVIRLYETEGAALDTTLTLAVPGRAMYETDMLENPTRRLPADGGKVALHFRPFEIKTVLVER